MSEGAISKGKARHGALTPGVREDQSREGFLATLVLTSTASSVVAQNYSFATSPLDLVFGRSEDSTRPIT